MRKERRLRVFENRVLRRIYGAERDEVTGEWRKLHTEEHNDRYCSGDQIDKKEVGGACSTMGKITGAYKLLVQKSEGKRPLVRPWLRWEDDIKMDLQKVV